MDAPISKFEFQRMALMLSLRDLFSAPESTLAEADIRPGFYMLDYGCGSGSFTLADRGLSDLKPGDLVNVWITDQVITTFAKLG